MSVKTFCTLAPSTRPQKLAVVFFLAACAGGAFYSYLFSYHILPAGTDRKFPTPWRVFEFNLNIWIVVVLIWTAVFGSLLRLLRRSDDCQARLRDYATTIAVAILTCSGAFCVREMSGFILIPVIVLAAGAAILQRVLVERPEAEIVGTER